MAWKHRVGLIPRQLQKADDLFPKLRRLDHEGFVVGLRELPKPFWTGIAVIKPAAESLRHDPVLAPNQYCDWAVIVLQIILGREALGEYPPNREDRHVGLAHVRQTIVWRQQHNAGHLGW